MTGLHIPSGHYDHRKPSEADQQTTLTASAVLRFTNTYDLRGTEPEGDGAPDGREAKGKRKAGSARSAGKGGADGDAPKRRKGTSGATKKPKRAKPSHPYVEVEYEEETENAASESMSFNW